MSNSELDSPEGIERRHVHDGRRPRWRHWPLGLVALFVLLAVSAFGVYGREAAVTDDGDEVRLSVHGPVRIRNGELFEMTMTVEALRAIDEVVLRVDEEIWRNFTINTLIPGATEEGYEAGAFWFSFGRIEAEASLVFKVDGQVNPDHGPTANEGIVSVTDGDGRVLAEVPYEVEVLP